MKKEKLQIYSFYLRNRIFLSLVIVGFLFSQQVLANGGYGNFGIIIQKNGASKTPYIVNSGFNNDGFCSWYTLSSAQTFNSYNFGQVSALALNGLVIDGWTDNSDFVAGQVEYRIWLQSDLKPSSATGTFNVGGYGTACSVQDVQCSSGNNRRVGWDGSSVNILSGLAPGVYNFEIISHNQLRYNCGSWNQLDNAAVTATFTVTSSATDYYRSKATGNWNSTDSWESSPNNINWGTATLVPGVSASSITILNGHIISINGNLILASLTLNSGSTINVNAGIQLTVSTSMTNNGTLNLLSTSADGTATILAPTSISGTGIANVNQYLTNRTWYLSSPVNSAAPSNMSVINYFDETVAGNVWRTPAAMIVGTGYLVTPNISTYANNILFSGTLNAGSQAITLTRTPANTDYPGFNLIGNPYPAYLDWTAVCGYTTDLGVTHPNQAIMPTTTMWYRTKVSGTWGFVTVNGAGVTSPSGNNVTNFIPPMQAFWVRATTGGGSLQLTNSMCSHAATSNPLKAPAAKNTEQLELVRLQVNNGINTDEAVIYFSAIATNSFDIYDAPKMSNTDTTIPQIYTLLNNEQIVINAMNTIPLDQEISLGFVPGSATSFSLKANEISNLPSNVKLILKDNVTKAETDLTDGLTVYNYTSTTANDNRFSIIFRSSSSITGTFNNTEKNISVYKNAQNRITINCSNELSGQGAVSVYNMIGEKLASQALIGTTTVLNKPFASGVYLVSVVSNGKTSTHKIIIN